MARYWCDICWIYRNINEQYGGDIPLAWIHNANLTFHNVRIYYHKDALRMDTFHVYYYLHIQYTIFSLRFLYNLPISLQAALSHFYVLASIFHKTPSWRLHAKESHEVGEVVVTPQHEWPSRSVKPWEKIAEFSFIFCYSIASIFSVFLSFLVFLVLCVLFAHPVYDYMCSTRLYNGKPIYPRISLYYFILIEIYRRHVCLLRWKNDIKIRSVSLAKVWKRRAYMAKGNMPTHGSHNIHGQCIGIMYIGTVGFPADEKATTPSKTSASTPNICILGIKAMKEMEKFVGEKAHDANTFILAWNIINS